MDFWKKWSKIPAWAVGTATGICFLIIGVYQNQFLDIYRKAVVICLECIGIGQREKTKILLLERHGYYCKAEGMSDLYEKNKLQKMSSLCADTLYASYEWLCLWLFSRKNL